MVKWVGRGALKIKLQSNILEKYDPRWNDIPSASADDQDLPLAVMSISLGFAPSRKLKWQHLPTANGKINLPPPSEGTEAESKGLPLLGDFRNKSDKRY